MARRLLAFRAAIQSHKSFGRNGPVGSQIKPLDRVPKTPTVARGIYGIFWSFSSLAEGKGCPRYIETWQFKSKNYSKLTHYSLWNKQENISDWKWNNMLLQSCKQPTPDNILYIQTSSNWMFTKRRKALASTLDSSKKVAFWNVPSTSLRDKEIRGVKNIDRTKMAAKPITYCIIMNHHESSCILYPILAQINCTTLQLQSVPQEVFPDVEDFAWTSVKKTWTRCTFHKVDHDMLSVSHCCFQKGTLKCQHSNANLRQAQSLWFDGQLSDLATEARRLYQPSSWCTLVVAMGCLLHKYSPFHSNLSRSCARYSSPSKVKHS